MKSFNSKEERRKVVRQIQKELRLLKRAKSELEPVPLEKPIRNGWYKHLILRDDIARRKDADLYQEILNVGAQWVWGNTKKAANKKWDRYVIENKEWIWPGFACIDSDQHKSLPEKAKQLFYKYELSWSSWRGRSVRYYCLVPSYYFKIVYSKAYITHLQLIDSELQQRVDKLEANLVSNLLYSYSWNVNRGWMTSWERRLMNRKIRHRANTALQNYDERHFDLAIGKALI